MMNRSSERTKKGFSKKIMIIVSIFLFLALSIVLTTYFGNKILTGARAYVAGEGFWTKAQKEGVLHLTRYLNSGDKEGYQQFKKALKINKGDKKARLTLSSENPDYDEAFDGFLQGKNHPKDIPAMIWMFDNFKDVSYMETAIGIWEQADKKIAELDSLATEIHQAIQQQELTQQQENHYFKELFVLDAQLTEYENAFSRTMGIAARKVNQVIFWTTIGIGITLVLIGAVITTGIVRNVRNLNQKLTVSESKFRNVLENSRDVLYQMDLNSGDYIYMSPSVEDMIGFSAEVMISKGPGFVIERMHPDDRKRMQDELEEIKQKDIEDHFKTHTEFRVKTKNGDYIWVSNKRSLLKNDQGESRWIVGSVRDISDRKEYEEQIDRSLKEKEVLLQEVHHRVKNNLAIISSLLELQKSDLDPEIRDIFDESQSRIKSIAMVHEKLYQSDTLSDISMLDYIDELTKSITAAYASDMQGIEVEKDIDDIALDISDAISCGLIYNELLSNVYKHAFKQGHEGIIKVFLKRKNGNCVLSVADNGKGLPDDFDIRSTQSLGMTLVNTLSKQLGAELEFSSEEWTEFRIVFEYSSES